MTRNSMASRGRASSASGIDRYESSSSIGPDDSMMSVGESSLMSPFSDYSRYAYSEGQIDLDPEERLLLDWFIILDS